MGFRELSVGVDLNLPITSDPPITLRMIRHDPGSYCIMMASFFSPEGGGGGGVGAL